MIETYVLQLVRERLVEGELVGQLEIVETGERVPVRTVDDLVRGTRLALGPDAEETVKGEPR